MTPELDAQVCLFIDLCSWIANGGLWHSFLTRPLGFFMPEGLFVVRKPWPFECILRLLDAALFLAALPLSLVRHFFDP